jgi:hypothetical protein
MFNDQFFCDDEQEETKRSSDENDEKHASNDDLQLSSANHIKIGVVRRKTLKIEKNSVLDVLKKGRACCQRAYRMNEQAHYYMPPYRSHAVTYNYLVGVFNGDYYCPMGDICEYEKKLKVNAKMIYHEILKLAPKHLGYDTSNLPPKNYLTNVLFNLSQKHYFFTTTLVNCTVPQTEDGLYIVPENCAGYLKISKFNAQLNSDATLQGTRKDVVKELKRSTAIVSQVEHIKSELLSLSKKLKKSIVFESGDQLINLQHLFKFIQ